MGISTAHQHLACLATVVGVAVLVEGSQPTREPFSCLGTDVCNHKGSDWQYCDEVFTKRCRYCSSDRKLCMTSQMPKNCTMYCTERLIEIERVKGCPPLNQTSRGHHNGSEAGTRYGDVIRVECEAGYHCDGSCSVTCADFGYYTGLLRCEEIKCPPFLPPTNGKLSTTKKDYDFGERIGIACSSGFELDGAGFATCKSDGSWDIVNVGICVKTGTITLRLTMLAGILVGTFMGTALVTALVVVVVCCVCRNRGRISDREKVLKTWKPADVQGEDDAYLLAPSNMLEKPTYTIHKSTSTSDLRCEYADDRTDTSEIRDKPRPNPPLRSRSQTDPVDLLKHNDDESNAGGMNDRTSSSNAGSPGIGSEYTPSTPLADSRDSGISCDKTGVPNINITIQAPINVNAIANGNTINQNQNKHEPVPMPEVPKPEAPIGHQYPNYPTEATRDTMPRSRDECHGELQNSLGGDGHSTEPEVVNEDESDRKEVYAQDDLDSVCSESLGLHTQEQEKIPHQTQVHLQPEDCSNRPAKFALGGKTIHQSDIKHEQNFNNGTNS